MILFKKYKWDILFFSMAILTLICFWNSEGMSDIGFYKRWITKAADLGVVAGFEANADMYPPLCTLLHFAVYKAGAGLLDRSHTIMLVNFIFILVTALLVRLYTRKTLPAALTFASCLISVTNAYIDILTAPFLLLGVLSLEKKKYIPAGIFLALMCLMKFQPLIMMPFFAAYFVTLMPKKPFIRFDVKPLVFLGASAMAVVAITFAVYGFPFITALKKTFMESDSFYAPQALGLPWLLQYLYEIFTGTYDGRIALLRKDCPSEMYLTSHLFWLVYIILFVWYLLREKKDIQTLLGFSCAAFLSYYLLHTGVHENHYFMGMLLGIILYINNKNTGNLFIMVTGIFTFNINVLIFYGLSGTGPGFTPGLGSLDPSAALAVFNLITGIMMICIITLKKPSYEDSSAKL